MRSLGHCPSESQLQEVRYTEKKFIQEVLAKKMDCCLQVIGEMEDPEQMGYIHLDRFLPVMSRLVTLHSSQLFEPLVWFLPAAHEDLLAAFQVQFNSGQIYLIIAGPRC